MKLLPLDKIFNPVSQWITPPKMIGSVAAVATIATLSAYANGVFDSIPSKVPYTASLGSAALSFTATMASNSWELLNRDEVKFGLMAFALGWVAMAYVREKIERVGHALQPPRDLNEFKKAVSWYKSQMKN